MLNPTTGSPPLTSKIQKANQKHYISLKHKEDILYHKGQWLEYPKYCFKYHLKEDQRAIITNYTKVMWHQIVDKKESSW